MEAKENLSKTAHNRISWKISLTKREREVIVSHLPKNYTLIDVKEWTVHLTKQDEKRAEEERRQKAMKKCEVKVEEMMQNMTIKSARRISNIEEKHSPAKLPPEPKKDEQAAIVQPQDTPTKQNEENEPTKSSYGPQQTIILKLIAKVVNHPEFATIYHTKMEPSTQTQVRSMKGKLKGNYTLLDFQSDINQLFTGFFEQVGPNERVSILKDLINNNIKIQLARIKPLSPLNENLQQQSEHAHNVEQHSRSQSRQPISSRMDEEESDFRQSVESSSKEYKDSAITRQRIKNEAIVARTNDSFISGNDMATLGFNIRKLSSANLKYICQNFISGSRDKMNINHQNFYLDIEALSKRQFCQLEFYVKNRLRLAGIPYEKPSEEDDGFVIKDDEEQV